MKTASLIVTSTLLGAGYAAVSPSQWSTTSKSATGNQKFSLQQIENERFPGLQATEALLSAYARFATSVPKYIKNVLNQQPALKMKFAALSAENPSVVSAEALAPVELDSEYVIPVQVGTPPQTLPLNLDTGSADFWVFSTDTPADELQGQKIYHPNDSSTSSILPNARWKIKYGDGSGANGTVYLDRAAIGPLGFDKQAIQVATAISPDIASDQFFSGVIGMASSWVNTVSPIKQLTFLENIKGDLEKPVFTANLQKGRPGSYDFGFINDESYIGSIAYTPINIISPFWQVQLSGYQLGAASDYKKEVITGIVDTGTSLLLLPQHIVDEYYDMLHGSYFERKTATWMYPCALTPPDFVFGIGDYRGIVPGHYMNYAQYTDKYCYGGLQTSQGIPFSVFGDILLKAQFVVFDRGNLAVGFANKKTVPPPEK